MYDFSAANDNLEEMLALLTLMDEYVGVSNTNMRLMAGLGRKARVLVPHPPEWRWMEGGQESPWFPDFNTYREDRVAGWNRAFAQLLSDLSGKYQQNV